MIVLWAAFLRYGWIALGFLGKLPWQVWAIAGIAIGVWFVYHKGDEAGATRVQTQWAESVAKTTAILEAKGKEANASAEKSVPALSPADRASDAAVVPRGEPCRVFNPWDRDCAGRSR